MGMIWFRRENGGFPLQKYGPPMDQSDRSGCRFSQQDGARMVPIYVVKT